MSKKEVSEILPRWPLIVVERINREGTTKGGVIVPRREQEETPYAVVFEPGANEDFEVGDVLMVNAHCGHDVWLEDGLALTILHPDDALAKVDISVDKIREEH